MYLHIETIIETFKARMTTNNYHFNENSLRLNKKSTSWLCEINWHYNIGAGSKNTTLILPSLSLHVS